MSGTIEPRKKRGGKARHSPGKNDPGLVRVTRLKGYLGDFMF